ncbi:unnamed protein product, partial [Nesidiocoris tenuis]
MLVIFHNRVHSTSFSGQSNFKKYKALGIKVHPKRPLRDPHFFPDTKEVRGRDFRYLITIFLGGARIQDVGRHCLVGPSYRQGPNGSVSPCHNSKIHFPPRELEGTLRSRHPRGHSRASGPDTVILRDEPRYHPTSYNNYRPSGRAAGCGCAGAADLPEEFRSPFHLSRFYSLVSQYRQTGLITWSLDQTAKKRYGFVFLRKSRCNIRFFVLSCFFFGTR